MPIRRRPMTEIKGIQVIATTISGSIKDWGRVEVDGDEVAAGRYQAVIVVNGDMGKDLPFARGVPLGSGDFHLFGLKDLGVRRLAGQFRRTFDASLRIVGQVRLISGVGIANEAPGEGSVGS
jgi:hypothetical protein